MPYRYVTEHRRDGRLKHPAATARTAMHLARHVKPSASLSRRSVGKFGGCEVHLQGSDGMWRDSDSVPPASDPNPPKQ